MASFILLMFMIMITTLHTSEHKFPHINFLGTSYNIINANTQSIYNKTDPGFTNEQIVIFTSNYSTKTSDKRYNIPNNTQVYYIGAGDQNCSLYNGISTTIKGDNSYTLSLSTDTKINQQNQYNYINSSFTESSTYKKFTETIYSSTNINNVSVIVSVTDLCHTYFAQFNTIHLSSQFINDIYELPNEIFNKTDPYDQYYKFIDKYGHYYASEIIFGSKYTQSLVFNYTAWNSMIYQDFNITNLSITYYEMSIDINIKNKTQTQAATNYSKYSYQTFKSLIGTNPTGAKGNNYHWLNHTKE
eukprot:530544_1